MSFAASRCVDLCFVAWRFVVGFALSLSGSRGVARRQALRSCLLGRLLRPRICGITHPSASRCRSSVGREGEENNSHTNLDFSLAARQLWCHIWGTVARPTLHTIIVIRRRCVRRLPLCAARRIFAGGAIATAGRPFSSVVCFPMVFRKCVDD